MCKRARPDAQPTMAALCMRVKAPGEKDWNKLVRLMKCSHSTVNNTLTLDAGNRVQDVEWSVDSAFGVHPDFKSHVSGTMTFEGGKRIGNQHFGQTEIECRKLHGGRTSGSELHSTISVVDAIIFEGARPRSEREHH